MILNFNPINESTWALVIDTLKFYWEHNIETTMIARDQTITIRADYENQNDNA